MDGVEHVCFVIGYSKLIARKIGQNFMVKRDWNDYHWNDYHSPDEQHEVSLNLSKLFQIAHTYTAEMVWTPMLRYGLRDARKLLIEGKGWEEEEVLRTIYQVAEFEEMWTCDW